MPSVSPASRRTPVLIASGLALAVLLAGCGSSSSTKSSSSNSSTAVAAASSTTGDDHTANITLTTETCKSDRTSYAAGGVTFNIKNTDATGVTEFEVLDGDRIVGEKENLPPGFSGSFSINLEPGDYILYCPGATTARVPLKITGTATTAPATTTHALLVQGAAQYAQYVTAQVALLVDGVKPLSAALTANKLAAAQSAYISSRKYYERIEPVAESFAGLDPAIDARQGDVPDSQWIGFHRIEKGLFQTKSTAGLATLGTQLLANVEKLQTLTNKLTYQPSELANGATGLLDEVFRTKITGEEERYSHIDLVDLQANVEGSQQAFSFIQPGLVKIDATLTSTITAAFAAADTLLDKYRSTTDPSGFVRFTALTKADTTAIANAVSAIQEPLSRVASKIVKA